MLADNLSEGEIYHHLQLAEDTVVYAIAVTVQICTRTTFFIYHTSLGPNYVNKVIIIIANAQKCVFNMATDPLYVFR